MTPEVFTTRNIHARHQHEAWREWFGPVFEVEPGASGTPGFAASNVVWRLEDLVVSRVSAPAVQVQRTPAHIRRNPVDHWVLSYCEHGEMTLLTARGDLRARPGVPFLWSLAEPSRTVRTDTERLQLFLSRDVFRDIAPALDGARGAALDTPLGRLLADFMLSLERRLPDMSSADVPWLAGAAGGLIAACIAPSAERMEAARDQIALGRLERVRQAVASHLRSPRLGPDTLCRAVGISRSGLYRLLEAEGGVARYIQRRRLQAAYAMLSDPDDKRTISAIAEALCFSDASSFARAFRANFGYSASDARAAAAAGLTLVRGGAGIASSANPNFGALLSGF